MLVVNCRFILICVSTPSVSEQSQMSSLSFWETYLKFLAVLFFLSLVTKICKVTTGQTMLAFLCVASYVQLLFALIALMLVSPSACMLFFLQFWFVQKFHLVDIWCYFWPTRLQTVSCTFYRARDNKSHHWNGISHDIISQIYCLLKTEIVLWLKISPLVDFMWRSQFCKHHEGHGLLVEKQETGASGKPQNVVGCCV